MTDRPQIIHAHPPLNLSKLSRAERIRYTLAYLKWAHGSGAIPWRPFRRVYRR